MYSEYFYTLNLDAKARYIDKIKRIDGIDPYTLPKKELSTEKDHFPDLTYMDMINYLVHGISFYTSDEFKAYKSLQAYNQYQCGWVHDVRGKVFSDMNLVIGKVKHSQRLSEKPLEPWFIANKLGNVQSAHCNCMAGLGEACTHVAALMFFVDNITHLKENPSVTSVAPYWGQSKKDVPFSEVKDIRFTLKETSNIQVSTSTPTIPRLDDKDFMSLCSTLHGAGCGSAILNIVKPFNNTETNKHYLANLYKEENLQLTLQELVEQAETVSINVDATEARRINSETSGQAKTRKWFRYRAGRITASTLKSVCSTNISSPAISTIKKICYPASMAFQTRATTWGCKHEGTARKEYVKQQKNTHPSFQVTACGLIINPDYPHMGASPDGLVSCDCCGLGCLEIKCPYSLRKKEDKLEKHKCLEVVDGKPVLSKKHSYYFQIQCQLFITQRSYCDFVLWKENYVHIERILPDEEFWNEVSVKANDFFRAVLLPEMMGKVYTQPCFPDGTDRKIPRSPEAKQPTIVYL